MKSSIVKFLDEKVSLLLTLYLCYPQTCTQSCPSLLSKVNISLVVLAGISFLTVYPSSEIFLRCTTFSATKL